MTTNTGIGASDPHLEWVSPCHHRIELPHWIGDERAGSVCPGTTREVVIREDWAVWTDRGGRKHIKELPADKQGDDGDLN